MQLLIILILATIPQFVLANGCGDHVACEIEDGDFYIALPPEWDGHTPLPALLFFHGHRSSGGNVIKNKGMLRVFHERGYAVIAPNGPRFRASDGKEVRGWPGRETANGRR